MNATGKKTIVVTSWSIVTAAVVLIALTYIAISLVGSPAIDKVVALGLLPMIPGASVSLFNKMRRTRFVLSHAEYFIITAILYIMTWLLNRGYITAIEAVAAFSGAMFGVFLIYKTAQTLELRTDNERR